MALAIPSAVPADFAYAVEWIHQTKTRLMIPSAGIDRRNLVERRSSPGRSVNIGCYEPFGFFL
jgi:hypothetical protein